MKTTEYRVCWNDWRRNSAGEKVDVVIRVGAVDQEQAARRAADTKNDAWIETRTVTDWKRQ